MIPAIQIDNLSYRFDTRTVVAGMTFQIPEASFFTIIGPNGTGKTTLLKLIAGIWRPETGSIRIQGQPLPSVGRKKLAHRLAYVPQTNEKGSGFRVRELVLMGRAPYLGLLGFESPKDHEIARDAMQFTGIHHLADRKLGELSGGERQCIFLARAICQQPRILLLDEPTAALDLAHQVRIMDLMERLKLEKGITIVMVSHDLNLAAMYADRIMLMDKGRIAAIGNPGEVLAYDRLEAVYGCPLLVDESPIGGYPQVHLVPGRYLNRRADTPPEDA